MGLKEHARRYFEEIAELYDETWIPKGAEGLSRILIQKAGIEEGCYVLDAAAGTGCQSVQIAYAVGKKGGVVGVDVSKSMLREAKRKIEKLRLEDRIELILADVENVPLGNDSVDAIICAFACHHFPHPLQTIREMSRVLKPNKRAVIVDACRPESLFKRLISDIYAKITDRSWKIRFYSEREFKEFFRKSGFRDVHSYCFYQTHDLKSPSIIIEGTK